MEDTLEREGMVQDLMDMAYAEWFVLKCHKCHESIGHTDLYTLGSNALFRGWQITTIDGKPIVLCPICVEKHKA